MVRLYRGEGGGGEIVIGVMRVEWKGGKDYNGKGVEGGYNGKGYNGKGYDGGASYDGGVEGEWVGVEGEDKEVRELNEILFKEWMDGKGEGGEGDG